MATALRATGLEKSATIYLPSYPLAPSPSARSPGPLPQIPLAPCWPFLLSLIPLALPAAPCEQPTHGATGSREEPRVAGLQLVAGRGGDGGGMLRVIKAAGVLEASM